MAAWVGSLNRAGYSYAKLGLHQDRDEKDAWARWFPFRMACLPFSCGAVNADPRRLRLENGDVAVLGGPARFVYHGVAPLKDGQHP